MFSEHSGIINIALEGIMVIGGVAGVLTLTMLPAEMPVFLVVLISVPVSYTHLYYCLCFLPKSKKDMCKLPQIRYNGT